MGNEYSPACARSSRRSLERRLRYHDVQLKGKNEVCWDPYSLQHPKNWSSLAKFQTTIVIYWLEFFMTAISTSGTAAADSAMKEYGISRTLAYFAFVTIYLLGQLIGGIFCSPISEVFGRRTIYGIATALFCASSAVVAAPRSVIAIYVGRCFQGIAAAIPATVAFGNFNDMFDAQARVWIVYGYTLFGMMGLALGPIYSSYVAEAIGWRWIFYISTMVSGASLIFCILMKESNASQILEVKVDIIRKETGYRSLSAAESGSSRFSLSTFVTTALYRPIIMLVTEPLVFFCAMLCGIAFGLVYGLTESLTIVYTAEPFSFSTTRASLPFIAILIGECLNILPRFYDIYLLRRKRKLSQQILPETKITSFAIACPALAVGLWLFGWTIPDKITDVPWPVSMIGLVLIGFALNDFSYVLFGYVGDSYGPYAASAAGALSTTRCTMAAIFPLFTTQMYEGLGNNIATTILAAVATAFCFTPWLFLKYGGRLRQRSKMASDDDDCLVEENQHLKEKEDSQRQKALRFYGIYAMNSWV